MTLFYLQIFTILGIVSYMVLDSYHIYNSYYSHNSSYVSGNTFMVLGSGIIGLFYMSKLVYTEITNHAYMHMPFLNLYLKIFLALFLMAFVALFFIRLDDLVKRKYISKDISFHQACADLVFFLCVSVIMLVFIIH